MSRKIYFDSQFGTNFYAVTEDGVLTEFDREPVDTGAVIGNVYKGRVTDVLNGMQAAFVDCGLERHCYLSASDADGDKSVGESEAPLNLKVGDEILVQVTRAASGKKGAKVTQNISFVGKYVVYTPYSPFVGVSAKIDDEELRANLIFDAKRYLTEGEGLIIRTAAPYAVHRDKLSEIEYFRKLTKNIEARFVHAPVGELLYSDSPLYMRILRDIMFRAGDEIHVGDRRIYESVKEVAENMTSPMVEVVFHEPHTDMMYSEGVSEQVLNSLKSKAELSNGAYIVIDRTEALTVFDVNTGKFTGEDSFEHTVYYTNVLATREIARQVKLRNLGGLFVVDFIDMEEEKHSRAIVEELERALRADGAKCKVLPMSKFGLVEFTRKRTGAMTSEKLLRHCKECDGAGVVRTHESILTEFRAKLLKTLNDGATTVCVDLNFDVANTLAAHRAMKENIAGLYPHARVYIVSHRTYREDMMYFRSVNSTNFALPEGTILLY